jgi:hypothetical protein
MRKHTSKVVPWTLVVALFVVLGPPRLQGQEALVPGTSYFGTNEWIEYIPGDLPLIFSAPHGGGLTPSSIPVRTSASCGSDDFSTTRDANTEELTREILAAFFARTGKYPHVVINRLHRNRLDANREIDAAACGDPGAVQAWQEFHAFINTAKGAVLAEQGKGWYTDVHGHGHEVPRLELGYNMSATTLRRSDAELDTDPAFEASTAIKVFSQESPLSFSALLRGPTALGTLFERAGVRAVPSQQDPAPAEGEAFFSGGDNTRAHGCRDGGQICGVQIEHNRIGIRDTAENRAAYAARLVDVYEEYLSTNFDIFLFTPATAIESLFGSVSDLVTQGALSHGNGNSLLAKLKAALRQLHAGHRNPVPHQLAAFSHEVNALVHAGRLDAAEGDRLSRLAERIVRSMAL